MNFEKMDFKDKNVIVTGAAKGIGKAIAGAFSSCGAKVAICDLDENAARQSSEQISDHGGRSLYFKMDVAKRSDVEKVFGYVASRWEAPDILVNAAGIITRSPFLDGNDEDWDRVMNVNLKGTWLCSQTGARFMIASRKRGAIVNVGSISSEVSDDTQVIYSASKGGVRSLTKGMAIALAPYGIRVNAVGPATVETEMVRQFLADYPESLKNLLKRTPIGRIGVPDEIAGAVLYLASDWATFVTGSCLFLDGGRLSQNNI